MKYFQLKLLFQYISHSEKDKLVLVLYNPDTCSTSYKTYIQVKMTIVKNTMLNTSNFKPFYILPTKQEMQSVI